MQLELLENSVILWVIESPRIFRKFVEEIMEAHQIKQRNFVLSDADNEVDIIKESELIKNPLDINLYDKKITNKIYKDLNERAYNESFYVKTQNISSLILSHIMSLEDYLSFSLEYEKIDFIQILKSFDIKISICNDNLVDKINNYLHVLAELLNKKVVMFINLSLYLEKEEIEALIKEAFYLKLYVILIENTIINLDIDKKCYIIDKDYCEIY